VTGEFGEEGQEIFGEIGNMHLEPRRLDELGFLSRGKSKHRPRDAAHLYGGPYPFIQTGDVKHSNLYINSYSQTYSEEGLAQSPEGLLCSRNRKDFN